MNAEATVTVKLTDAELVHLDGRCGNAAQAAVDAAKARQAARERFPDADPAIAGFVADAVSRAKADGRLVHQHRRLRYCNVCRAAAGYAKYARTTHLHRKGAPNHDRPLTIPGVELREGFIRVEGYASLGCCTKCWETAKPLLAEALAEVEAELPASLAGAGRYRKYRNRRCRKCGWEGHEGEMRQLRALMGDGTYPGGCPNCPAENVFLSTDIDTTPGFRIVEVAPA